MSLAEQGLGQCPLKMKDHSIKDVIGHKLSDIVSIGLPSFTKRFCSENGQSRKGKELI